MDLETHLEALLADAESRDLLRTPGTYEPRAESVVAAEGPLVSFASNDYLGLAHHPQLREALAEGALTAAGAGSSRLVAGTASVHRRAEAALAAAVGLPGARLFSAAYLANVGLLAGLFGLPDLILSDALNHASLIDGCRLSRARTLVYRHGDLDHLSALLRAHRSSARVAAIVSESAFSMDGDIADVAALRRIASQHSAALIVDEAHALGVLGPRGAGVCAGAGVSPDVLIGGLGKAFGLAGGFVAGSVSLVRALDNFARTFVFSTAILPAIAHAVPTSVQLLEASDAERKTLQVHAGRVRATARALGLSALGAEPGVILPLVLGSPEDAVRASAALRDRGFLVPAMRPPTVAAGSARLRITPTSSHSEGQLIAFCRALSDVLGGP